MGINETIMVLPKKIISTNIQKNKNEILKIKIKLIKHINKYYLFSGDSIIIFIVPNLFDYKAYYIYK